MMRRLGVRAAAAGAACAVLMVAGCSSYNHPDPGEVGGAGPRVASPSPSPPAPVVATVDSVFPKRPAFGITLTDPSEANLAKITTSTGCRPQLVQRFVSVASGLSLTTLRNTPGVPLLSLEPWHSGQGPHQSDFTLKATVNGRWDQQYRSIAQAVLSYHDPVVIRFAHEMNGDWYPWGITNGNTSADYVAAWKHVVQLFRAVGTTNVLWVWSPNILRGANSTKISQFWPGADYVDMLGLTGYGEHETTPEATFTSTINAMVALADKPVLLSEIGVQADSNKNQWLAALGPWLRNHPKIVGFVWFQNTGKNTDWRFDDTPANLAVFKTSLAAAQVPCQA
jgi:hypothetical protein